MLEVLSGIPVTEVADRRPAECMGRSDTPPRTVPPAQAECHGAPEQCQPQAKVTGYGIAAVLIKAEQRSTPDRREALLGNDRVRGVVVRGDLDELSSGERQARNLRQTQQN